MDLDAGKVGRQLTLLRPDEPLDDTGRGPSGLLRPAPYRLHPPMGLPEDPVGPGHATVRGPLGRRPRPVLGGRRPIPAGQVPIPCRGRPIRRRPPLIGGRRCPVMRRRRPVLGRRLPVRRIQFPVDGRLLIATNLAGIGGPRPSVRHPVPPLGRVISPPRRPVTLDGGLLPLLGRLFPDARQLITPATEAVTLVGKVVMGRCGLVALIGRPVPPLSHLFPVPEPSVSTHSSTPIAPHWAVESPTLYHQGSQNASPQLQVAWVLPHSPILVSARTRRTKV